MGVDLQVGVGGEIGILPAIAVPDIDWELQHGETILNSFSAKKTNMSKNL